MKKSNVIKTAIFACILILPSLLWGLKLLTTDEGSMAGYYDAVETRENRALATLPTDVTDPEYTSKLEEYYNDHAPYREEIITKGQVMSSGMEKIYLSGIRPAVISTLYSGRSSEKTVLEVPEAGTEYDTGVISTGADGGAVTADGLTEDEGAENAEETKPSDMSEEEHDYVEKERVEPECETDGYILYECSECGDTYKETLPATGHNEELVSERESSYLSYGCKIYRCTVCGKKIWKDFEPKLVDTSYFPLRVENNYTVMGRYDWMFYRGDASLTYYTGENIMDEATMDSRLKQMEELKALCDQKGKKLVYMIIPNKEIVYSEYMPSMDIVNEKRRNDVFYEYAREHSDINIIYPLTELKNAKMYYDTYYRYDTHWNEFGAYVGTMALYDALGMETMDISQADASESEMIVYGLVLTGGLPLENYYGATDYLIEYKPGIGIDYEEGKKDYIFGYSSVYKSKAQTGNDESMVFIGDSFREWMVKYLSKDFNDFCMVQREDIKLIEDEIRDADVIVLSAVERYDEDMYARIPALIRILSAGE